MEKNCFLQNNQRNETMVFESIKLGGKTESGALGIKDR